MIMMIEQVQVKLVTFCAPRSLSHELAHSVDRVSLQSCREGSTCSARPAFIVVRFSVCCTLLQCLSGHVRIVTDGDVVPLVPLYTGAPEVKNKIQATACTRIMEQDAKHASGYKPEQLGRLKRKHATADEDIIGGDGAADLEAPVKKPEQKKVAQLIKLIKKQTTAENLIKVLQSDKAASDLEALIGPALDQLARLEKQEESRLSALRDKQHDEEQEEASGPSAPMETPGGSRRRFAPRRLTASTTPQPPSSKPQASFGPQVQGPFDAWRWVVILYPRLKEIGGICSGTRGASYHHAGQCVYLRATALPKSIYTYVHKFYHRGGQHVRGARMGSPSCCA